MHYSRSLVVVLRRLRFLVIGRPGGAFVRNTRNHSGDRSSRATMITRVFVPPACPAVRLRPRLVLYQNAICIVRADTAAIYGTLSRYAAKSTPAIAAAAPECDERRWDPSLSHPGRVMLRNCEFSAGGWKKGSGRRRGKGESEKCVGCRKQPAKFVTFRFRRAITIFDADRLITEPPSLRPILREMQFIVSLCRRERA